MVKGREWREECNIAHTNLCLFSGSAFICNSITSMPSPPPPLQDLRLERENLQAKVDLLSSLASKNSIAGPVYDCVVFNDGHSWR